MERPAVYRQIGSATLADKPVTRRLECKRTEVVRYQVKA
jgi:hypothetical protein